MSLNNNYVVDVEIFNSLSIDFGNIYIKPYKNIIEKLLEKNNCKKILPWTYASYYTFPKEIREKLKEKFEVICCT